MILGIILCGLVVISCIRCQVENCMIRAHNRRFDAMRTPESDDKNLEQQAGEPLHYEIEPVNSAFNSTHSAPQFVTVAWH